jgi:folate-dependent phosphoribosylglycinamide formyltransferase PurN
MDALSAKIDRILEQVQNIHPNLMPPVLDTDHILQVPRNGKKVRGGVVNCALSAVVGRPSDHAPVKGGDQMKQV